MKAADLKNGTFSIEESKIVDFLKKMKFNEQETIEIPALISENNDILLVVCVNTGLYQSVHITTANTGSLWAILNNEKDEEIINSVLTDLLYFANEMKFNYHPCTNRYSGYIFIN